MKIVQLSKQVITATTSSQPEPVSPGSIVKLDVLLTGSGAIDSIVSLQETDTPEVETSWSDTGATVTLSGQNSVLASDYAFITKRHYRVKPATLNAMAIYAVVSQVEEVDQPDRVVMLRQASSASKSKVFKLPSRKPITLDVHITGTVTVRLYASNVETQADGTRWGSPLREFTASTKVIIENEPWVNWMVEYTSGTGIANVVAGV